MIAQQYVYAFGGKAAVVRFVYHNPASSSGKTNYGINLANKRKILEDTGIKQSRAVDVLHRATICYDQVNSFDAYVMKGGSFGEYERICQLLISFAQKSYPVRITQIVCDFVKDDFEQIYFVGVKSFLGSKR